MLVGLQASACKHNTLGLRGLGGRTASDREKPEEPESGETAPSRLTVAEIGKRAGPSVVVVHTPAKLPQRSRPVEGAAGDLEGQGELLSERWPAAPLRPDPSHASLRASALERPVFDVEPRDSSEIRVGADHGVAAGERSRRDSEVEVRHDLP